MARPSGPKIRNDNTWTESKFNTFIRNQLRGATKRWGPTHSVLKDARVDRGLYLCAHCKQTVEVTIRDEETGKRVKNIHVDHIEPVVDPAIGFVSFDVYIERLFVEKDGLQVLCNDCHKIKTNNERALAKERRAGENIDE